MKKMVRLLFIGACLLGMAIPAGAQISYGIKGGLNLSRAPKIEAGGGNVRGQVGFLIGPIAELTLPISIIGFSVDGALLYSQKGGKIRGESAVQRGIEIPVNLKYSIGLGSLGSIFVAAGPEIFFNLRSEAEIQEIKADYNTAEFGINIGGGIKALGHFQVGANYTIPVSSSLLRDIATGQEIPNSSYKNRVGQVSIAYFF
ncbi:hypothetical protein EZS27_033268 [termite gut metagenome]|uniref:Outer membrane protein beta-barrel domain-containing protein n=1 Tax=termite gut metagenome TaxID=433724 RepID=A0A5J4Q605_9ZZZZ